MKTLHFLCFILEISCLFLLINACKKDDPAPEGIPEVSNTVVSEISATSVLATAEILENNIPADTLRGFCWSEYPVPTLADNFSDAGAGTGSFFRKLNGLKGQTKYYLRAFASNTNGTGYGPEVVFITGSYEISSVSTDSIAGILINTVRAYGNLISSGMPEDHEQGFCWSKQPNPTLSDQFNIVEKGSGTFSGKITGLEGQTRYYCRAYSTGSLGTYYGNIMEFNTMDSTLVDIDGNRYRAVQIGEQVWMAENLRVLRYRNGDSIENVTSHNRWYNMHTGGVRVFYLSMNDPEFYYNGYAATDSRMLAPEGWHIPALHEFDTLVRNCGGPDIAGNLLKEAGTLHWGYWNFGATNASGFTALPSGIILEAGVIYNGDNAYFWALDPPGFLVLSHSSNVYLDQAMSLYYGLSVRCIKD